MFSFTIPHSNVLTIGLKKRNFWKRNPFYSFSPFLQQFYLKSLSFLHQHPERFFLGIETSCDDTSVAIVSSHRQILALCTHHQTKLHELSGGIIPPSAATSHRSNLPSLLQQVIEKSQLQWNQLDAIAVTQGPGLSLCLNVGLTTAKTLAAVLNKPLIGVHHMEAHALTPRLTEPTPPSFPYLSLLVSGGHTLLVLTKNVSQHEVLGTTLDDAAGEAFDKVARFLGFPWLPIGGGAGASVEKYAAQAPHTTSLRFSVPFQDGRYKPSHALDFSFSGLKAQAHRYLKLNPNLSFTEKCDVAYQFQEAALNHILDRLTRAFTKYPQFTHLIVSGGVAANQTFQLKLTQVCEKFKKKVVVPPKALCTDNAAMIAWAGIEQYFHGSPTRFNVLTNPWSMESQPCWSLNELSKDSTSWEHEQAASEST